MKSDPKPSRLPCGHCGASTALSWHSESDALAMGQGQCPSCGYVVHSFASDEPLPLDVFLALVSAFPDTVCKPHFGPFAHPPKTPRGSLIA